MRKEELLKLDWISEKYPNILELRIDKCLNTFVLNKVLFELQKEYELVKIFNNYIRAFKK